MSKQLKAVNQENSELIAEVAEALLLFREYLPLYRVVLEYTGDREQAIKAVKWAKRMADEEENVA